MLHDPLTDVCPAELEDYRAQIREVVDGWKGGAAAAWEVQGNIPTTVYQQLGGAMQERWKSGDVSGLRHAAVLATEVARVSASLGIALGIHCEVFLNLLSRPRSTVLREAFMGGLDGRVIGCVASTEPEGGSALAEVRSVAIPSGAGDGWQLQGTKRYITSGTTATHAIVSAAVPSSNGRQPTLFLVPLDHSGVRRLHRFDTLGMRGSDTAAIDFDLHLPDDHRLTGVGMGLMRLSAALTRERLVGGIQLVVRAADALRFVIAYCRHRRVGGDQRLLDQQAVRHRLADHAARIHAGQAAAVAILHQLERGEHADTETAALKLSAARTAQDVADDVVQLLGGRGYTADYPAEQWWRDARFARIGGGTDEVMREILARRLDRADPETEQLIHQIETSIDRRIELGQTALVPPTRSVNGPATVEVGR
jgi:alkylation response protein AidB-like acyl-CoA dehydrogenase